MYIKQARQTMHPGSGLLNRLFFGWVGPVLRLGASRQLEPKDMLQLDDTLQPSACGEALAAALSKERNASLARCLLLLYWKPMVATGLIRLVNDTLAFAGPLLIKQLVDWLYSPPVPWPVWDSASSAQHSPAYVWMHRLWVLIKALCPGGPFFGLGLALALGGNTLIRAMLGAQFNWRLTRLQAQMRAGLQVLLYHKSLAIAHHLTPATRQPFSGLSATGHVPDTVPQHSTTPPAEEVIDVHSLVGVDIGQLLNLPNSLHELWSLPLQLIVALVLLYMLVRFAFVAGLLVAIALIPINRVISNKIVAATKDMLAAKDSRLSFTVELVSGLRPIKMLGWEQVVLSKIQTARQSELHALAIRKYLDAGCVYLWASTSLLFTCLTFGLVAILRLELTPGAAATSFALFQVLIMPLNAIPWVIIGVLQAFVSMSRIQRYFQQPEHVKGSGAEDTAASLPAADARVAQIQTQGQNDPHIHINVQTAENSSAIADTAVLPGCIATFKHAWFTWPHNHHVHEAAAAAAGPHSTAAGSQQHRHTEYCLSDINLSIPEQSLTVITGKVGSGKTSLLHALLGELAPVAGGAHVPGTHAVSLSISYAPQSPWLFFGTLRENILMGQTLDTERYQQVLDAAALLPDLASMTATNHSDGSRPAAAGGGDLTWLGDRGALLSGGQRARVSLARALYADTRVLLLDDILAALDPGSAAHVTAALLGPATTAAAPAQSSASGHVGTATSTCKLGPLLAGRTVVIVTQSPRWLSAADNVIVLNEGHVLYQGGSQGYMTAHHVPTTSHITSPPPVQGLPGDNAAAQEKADAFTQAEVQAVQSAEELTGVTAVGQTDTSPEATAVATGAGEEARAEGHVSAAVWWQYIKSVGLLTSLVVVVSLVFMQATKNGADIWVARWVASLQAASPEPASTTHLGQPLDMPFAQQNTEPTSEWVASSAWAAMPHHTLLSHTFHVHQMASAHVCPVGWHAPADLQLSSQPRQQAAPDPDVGYFLKGLVVIAGLSTVFTLIRSLSFAYAGLTAARHNHDNLLTALTAAPITYLEALPAGRIINRFTTDVSKIDESLPFILNIFLDQSIRLAGLVVVILLASPPLLVLLLPLGVAYRRLSTFYRSSSRELRRLDATALSPVYQGLSESKDAAACVAIRAFNAGSYFKGKHVLHVTAYQRAAITGSAASVWLSMRLQLLATFLITSLGLLTSFSRILSAPRPEPPDLAHWTGGHSSDDEAGQVSVGHLQQLPILMHLPTMYRMGSHLIARVVTWVSQSGSAAQTSLAGLCLAYTLPVVGLLEGLVGSGAETEAEMVSVERCVDMCSAPEQPDVLLPPSAAHQHTRETRKGVARVGGTSSAVHGGDGDSDLQQPLLLSSDDQDAQEEERVEPSAAGQLAKAELPVVEFSHVVLRYPTRPLPALSGCTFQVRRGEWVGVVGRNGAGKSSVLAALLRLIEIESGCICLSGLDVRCIPLRQLRARFAVMPQTPFLVSGTIRDNVDPHHHHTWQTITAALDAVHLLHVLLPAARAGQLRPPGSSSHTQLLHHALDAATGRSVLGLRVQGSYAGGKQISSAGGTADGDDQSKKAAAVRKQVSSRSSPSARQVRPAVDGYEDGASIASMSAQGGGEMAARSADLDDDDSASSGRPGGIGLSAGQQQLLCLCRLLLACKQVVLLDEATASVDTATALIMQKVLRQWLAGDLGLQGPVPASNLGTASSTVGVPAVQPGAVTVLEVSHQLTHVMEHSRVLVMQAGKVIESGSPTQLLAQDGSHFKALNGH